MEILKRPNSDPQGLSNFFEREERCLGTRVSLAAVELPVISYAHVYA